MYKLFISPKGQEFIINTMSNTFIPFDSANTDYQTYLKWLSEGNTPLPADASIEVNTSTTADDNTGAA